MDKLLIQGGHRLSGEIIVSGAKNAALPILCAGLLTADDLRLTNIPNLQDVSTMEKLLSQMGLRITQEGDAVVLNAAGALVALADPKDLQVETAPVFSFPPHKGNCFKGWRPSASQ